MRSLTRRLASVLALPFFLGWLLIMMAVAFMRGAPKRQPPADEPANWAQVLWLIVLFTFMPVTIVLIAVIRRLLSGA
jgi:hypothetical protein